MNEHVIVIGSGFGGLASALRARRMGFEVTVIERLEQLGGRAQTFNRDGFVFDAGPTVTQPRFCSMSYSNCSIATLRITSKCFLCHLGIAMSSTTAPI